MIQNSPVFRLKDPNFDGSEALAQIVASGGESTSVTVKMSASAGDNGVRQSTITTRFEVEADGAAIWSTSDTAATGETVSTSVQGTVSLNADNMVITANAKAAAEGEGANATANTDTGIGYEWSIIAFEQERFEVEADGAAIWSTSDTAATGETVSTSVQGTVSLNADNMVITANAKAAAEAAAEGEGANATANTDTGIGYEWSIIAFEQERFETDDDNPSAVSPTYLEVERDGLADLEATQLGRNGIAGAADFDWPL